jgi:hypothetical protein
VPGIARGAPSGYCEIVGNPKKSDQGQGRTDLRRPAPVAGPGAPHFDQNFRLFDRLAIVHEQSAERTAPASAVSPARPQVQNLRQQLRPAVLSAGDHAPPGDKADDSLRVPPFRCVRNDQIGHLLPRFLEVQLAEPAQDNKGR